MCFSTWLKVNEETLSVNVISLFSSVSILYFQPPPPSPNQQINWVGNTVTLSCQAQDTDHGTSQCSCLTGHRYSSFFPRKNHERLEWPSQGDSRRLFPRSLSRKDVKTQPLKLRPFFPLPSPLIYFFFFFFLVGFPLPFNFNRHHHYPSCQLAYKAATKLLHPCLFLASLWMVPKLWFSFFITTSKVLHQVVFGWPFFRFSSGVWWIATLVIELAFLRSTCPIQHHRILVMIVSI